MKLLLVAAAGVALTGCVSGGVGPLDAFLASAAPGACENAKYYGDLAVAVLEARGASAKDKHNAGLARGEVENLCKPGVQITAVTAVRLATAYRVIKEAAK